MDYEKKYKEALEKAKKFYNELAACRTKQKVAAIFPELAESEDERIREFLIDLLSHGTWKKDWPLSPAECVAWLEKQKEQKPVEIHIDNPNIEKFDPDMKITTSDSSADGDELLYVCNKSYKIGYRDGKRDAERKPAEYIPDSVKFSEGYKTGREVGFREGVESVKPAEWSEDDDVMLDKVCCLINPGTKLIDDNADYCVELKRWIISLRERILKSLKPSWKPTEEQMDSLRDTIVQTKGYSYSMYLPELYEQLKRLK